MTALDYAALPDLLAKATPGPWDAALEAGCHGVIAPVLPSDQNFVALVGNDLDTPEREPMRFANAALIALAPQLAADVIRLIAEQSATLAAHAALAADNARLTGLVDEARAAALREAAAECKRWRHGDEATDEEATGAMVCVSLILALIDNPLATATGAAK